MFTVAALSTTDVGAIATAAAKVALLTFIVAGVVTIIVMRRKRLREAHEEFMHTDVEELLHRRGSTIQPGYEASAHGAMPSTPWPAWTPDDSQDEPPPTPLLDEPS